MNKSPVTNKQKVSKRNKAFYGSLCIFLCILWGAGNPIIKIGMYTMPPFLMLGVRFFVAFLLFILIFKPKVLKPINKTNIIPCILICIFSAGAYLTATISLKLTEATISGFLMAIAVIFTPFLSFFILKTKTDKRLYLIIAVVIVGTYFLCGGGTDFSFGPGELLAVLSSVSLALCMILTSKHIERIGPLTLSTMQTLVIGIISICVAICTELPFDLGVITEEGWLSLLYQILFCSVITYIIQNIALKNLTAVFVSIVFCIEPVFTSLFSTLLLGEVLTVLGYLGGGLILTGLILASLIEEKAAEEL